MNFPFYLRKSKKIRKVITALYPFLFPLINFFARYFAKATSTLYFFLMKMDWGKTPPTEWMDHDQDQFYQFNSSGTFFYLERGILPRLYTTNFFLNNEEFKNLKLQKKLNVLDLCSGDSYFSQKFFYDLTDTIVSVDLDPKALARGKSRIKNNQYMNKKHYFFQLDVEKNKIIDCLKSNELNMKFDIILFNASIEHFKEEQLDFIFLSLKEVMKQKSFISTYTIVEHENDQKYLPDHHEMFFSSKEHLEKVVSKYFRFTKSHHSLINGRWNIYCVASDTKIYI